MNPWEEVYLQHYGRFFGKPFDVETFHGPEGIKVKLATFDQVPGYRAYASLGLAEYADELGVIGEVLLFSDVAGKVVPNLLVNGLCFVVQNRIPLIPHVAIGGLDALNPKFADDYDKQALLLCLADTFREGFEQVEGWEETGLMFQAWFVSWAEHDLLNRKGLEALQDSLDTQADNKVDIRSIRRPSSV